MSSIGIEVSTQQADTSLSRIAPSAQAALRAGVTKATIDLQEGVREAVENIFHSDGPLYKSIGSEIDEALNTVTGTVYSKGTVYAAAQEYGGTWQIPEIFPVAAKALAFGAPAKIGFSSGGGVAGVTIFAKHTKAHPVTLPARSYARSTLFRMRGQIADDVREATAERI